MLQLFIRTWSARLKLRGRQWEIHATNNSVIYFALGVVGVQRLAPATNAGNFRSQAFNGGSNPKNTPHTPQL